MSSKLMLLSPFNFSKTLTLKNRVALAPLTRARTEDQVPKSWMVDYYVQRASAGLLITEATSISEQGTGWPCVPGIYTPEHVEGWKLVTDAVHAKGGVIFLQAWHMGRVTHSSYYGLQPISASAVVANGDGALGKDCAKHPYEVPRALEISEIPSLIEEYVNAAKCSKEAGFDGFEIHSANGYLLDQWLQSYTNKRTDSYGGSFENRFRLLKEIIIGVSSVFPLDRIGVRLSPNGVYNDMGSEDNFEMFTFVISELNKLGIGYVHVMDGLGFGFHNKDKVFRLADARKHFDRTIIGNCGYTRDTAEGAVGTGAADMISFGRPYLANPDLVERFENNWPLADLLPYPQWYSPPFDDPAKGYSDQPNYSPSS